MVILMPPNADRSIQMSPSPVTFPYRYRVLVFLCSLTTLTYLDRSCISIVGVRLKADLGLSNQQFGWVVASFALAYALFEIPSGAWGDRIGPRAVFIRIVLWWSLFTALTGLVTGLVSLLVVRFLFGMGESGTMPNSILVVSRWFPVTETGRALPWVGIGTQIGAAIAPLVIVPLASRWGWRMPFFVNGAIGLGWVALCFWWFRNFPAQMRRMPDKEKNYIQAGCRHRDQQGLVPWSRLFRNRTIWALMAMYFCFQWANYFFIAWMPVYLQEKRLFTEDQTKYIIFLLFAAGVVGLLAGGFSSDWLVKKRGLRVGRRVIGMAGIGLCGLSILAAGSLSGPYPAAASLVAANFFYSFGVMTSFAVCTDIGRNNAGTVAGAMNFFGQIGAFFLAIVFGRIVQQTRDFNLPLLVIAAVLLAGTLLWLVIDPLDQLPEFDRQKPALDPAVT
jgi:MFS transporter, ACS family, glucarate transporter